MTTYTVIAAPMLTGAKVIKERYRHLDQAKAAVTRYMADPDIFMTDLQEHHNIFDWFRRKFA